MFNLHFSYKRPLVTNSNVKNFQMSIKTWWHTTNMVGIQLQVQYHFCDRTGLEMLNKIISSFQYHLFYRRIVLIHLEKKCTSKL